MFLTMAMLLACSVSRPFSANPNNYQPVEDYFTRGLYVQIEPASIGFTQGNDNILLSYYDVNTGSRTSLFTISIATDNNNQETSVYLTAYDTFNYYGYFTIYEIGSDINNPLINSYVQFYNSNELEYVITIPYSMASPSVLTDYSYALQLNYLDRGQFDTLSGASSNSYQDGYNQGVVDGKEIGKDIGYQDGYAQGREDFENQDTQINAIFEGILSIGLLPIEFFLSIFNFSIFGINITAIISAILTLCVIILLMRYVLGGKSN